MANNNPADSADIAATIDDDGNGGNAEVTATVARIEHDEIVVDDGALGTGSNSSAAAAAPVRSAGPQVIYVPVPHAPIKRGNRLFGSLVALMAAWVYGVLLAIVIAAISIAVVGRVNFGFVASPTFYIPVLFFAVAMVIVAAIANRAGWWSYVIGSAFVALVVYFGSTGTILLINGVVLATPEEARFLFGEVLVNPITIAAALVAREVAIWAGLLVSRRGKRVRTANTVARETYAREKSDREAAPTTITI